MWSSQVVEAPCYARTEGDGQIHPRPFGPCRGCIESGHCTVRWCFSPSDFMKDKSEAAPAQFTHYRRRKRLCGPLRVKIRATVFTTVCTVPRLPDGRAPTCISALEQLWTAWPARQSLAPPERPRTPRMAVFNLFQIHSLESKGQRRGPSREGVA